MTHVLGDFSWQVGHNWAMTQWIAREKYENLAGNHGFYHGFPPRNESIDEADLVAGRWSTGKPGRSTCFGLLGLLAPRAGATAPSVKNPSHMTSTIQYGYVIPPRFNNKNRVEYVWYWISIYSGWWFQTFFLVFHDIWDNPSHWLIFFKLVKATNQYCMGAIEWDMLILNRNHPKIIPFISKT